MNSKTLRFQRILMAAIVLAVTTPMLFASPVIADWGWPPNPTLTTIDLPGLTSAVRVTTDREGVRHLVADNDLDLALAQGYVHARDRFFQMDTTRRQVSGDLAELLGPDVLASDIQSRTIGLRRAAERTLASLSAEERAPLDAFAAGVNAWLASNPLPPEYAVLEITNARAWEAVDTVVIGKAVSASLSLDIDLGDVEQLEAYVAAGAAGGFDGQALFFEDVRRAAPIDAASTVPDATNGFPFAAKRTKVDPALLAKAASAVGGLKERLAQSPILALAMNRRETHVGSNEWGVAAAKSRSGKPMIANDPHLALDAPSTFYEIHLTVRDDPTQGPMNVSGVTFAGAPGVILGQNDRITWGATTNPMDVSDVFADTLIVDPFSTCAAVGSQACILSAGQIHPVEIETDVTYQINLFPDGVDDNLVPAPVPPENQIIATVPFRSFGPILSIADPSVLVTGGSTTALVLQYTGFHATRELLTFLAWNRAEDLDEFKDALANFDVGSQNWAYADVEGNLAYFASAEMPLRADLEQGTVIGSPPFFVRDGSGPNNWIPDPARSQGQAIPFAVLPAEEMPQVINPPNGFFVNANNDPAGTTLDNDPLNQSRVSNPGAIYYLNPSYADGLRAGRITRLIEDKLSRGKKISFSDMARFQSNTQQLDAELLLPILLQAGRNAKKKDAPAALADLRADARVREALNRLRRWDYSAPTGISEGYDAADRNGHRGPVSRGEKRKSVASTIYNVWRGQLIRNVLDARLAALGVPGVGSRDALKAVHNLLTTEPYTGVGVSGVDFIPEPSSLSAEARRDIALLGALRDALDALASPDYQEAFGGSTKLADYRWGRLHRITFDHPLGSPFSIPPAGGFSDLSPGLTGLSRDGGYEVVNASGFSARAAGENSFKFGSGPVRRYVGLPGSPFGGLFGPILGINVVAGGPSGDPTSALYATQLPDWLTSDYHLVQMFERRARWAALSLEKLVPAAD